MYIYIHLYVCIKEEKQDILNTCIYVLKSKALKKKCPDTTLRDKKPSKNTNEFIFFFLYIFCWACNPPSRVVGFPSETPLNELNYFMSVVTN